MFVATTHKSMPENILLTGGAANLPNLASALGSDMGMNVTLFNPFEHIDIDQNIKSEALTKIAPQLTIAAGLATRRLSQWQK